MCGFAGIVDFSGINESEVRPALVRAANRLQPRGPDYMKIWTDGYCALVNTRLAIQDLGPGASLPMVRNNFVIAYNGEIYNFREIREELLNEGYSFFTEGDTEVILIGWEAWGEGLLDRICGMFAFVIWDLANQRLHIARDRFGKKPILFIQKGTRITFGSDLASLECLLNYTPEIDPTALQLYFSLRWVPEPWSIAKDIHKLPAGSVAKFAPEGFGVRKWYSLSDNIISPENNETLVISNLVTNFDEAVKSRMISDVPLGVFLSGGIDSALVAASMMQQTDNVRSFTLGFEGAAEYYEERPAARFVADALGTNHTEFTVSFKEAGEALDSVFKGLDEPFADSSAIPTFLLAREARKHVKVVLTGDGADEIFGGYRKYQGELLARHYQFLPHSLRNLIIEPFIGALSESKTSHLAEKVRRLRRFVAHAGKDSIGRHVGWLEAMNHNELSSLFQTSSIIEKEDLRTLVASRRKDYGEQDPINAMLYGDISLGLVSDMLVKVDRMTMAASLEARSPFLDHKVVNLAASMPSHLKLRVGSGKWILRKAFADRLPENVFKLPKKGFEIPIAEWLTGPLSDLTKRAIDPERLRKQGLFNSEIPTIWYRDLEEKRKDSSEKLWMLVAFQAWCENFRPGV